MDSFSCINPETLKLLSKHNLLSLLIERELEIIKSKNIEIDKDEIEEFKKVFFLKKNIFNDGDYENWISRSQQAGMTIKEYDEYYVSALKKQRYYETEYGHMAESIFLKNKEDFDIVIYKLIRVKDKNLATEIYLQLKDKEIDFRNAAQKYSLGNEKHTNGVVGPIPLSRAHPILRDLLRTSSKNIINQPIQILDWWLIVKLESLEEATFDSEMKSKCSEVAFKKSIKMEASEIIKKLKSK